MPRRRWNSPSPSVTSCGSTKITPDNPMYLWGAMCAGGSLPAGTFHSAGAAVRLAALAEGSSLGGRLEELRGRNVLLATRDQLAAALALIELDGVARRIVLCPPDLAPSHFPAVIKTAEVSAWVRDGGIPAENAAELELCITSDPGLVHQSGLVRCQSHQTEWVL